MPSCADRIVVRSRIRHVPRSTSIDLGRCPVANDRQGQGRARAYQRHQRVGHHGALVRQGSAESELMRQGVRPKRLSANLAVPTDARSPEQTLSVIVDTPHIAHAGEPRVP